MSKEFNSLCAKYILVKKNAGHVSAGAVYTFDQSKADGVAADRKDYGHSAARTLGRACRSNISGGCNGNHPHSDKLSGKSRECLIVPTRPSFLNTDILAFNEPGLRQTLPKRVGIEAISIWRGAVQEAY